MLAAGLIACGDGEAGSTASSPSPQQAQAQGSQGTTQPSKREVPKPSSEADAVAISALDRSIETYGHVATASEQEPILASLQAFMTARAGGDYEQACELLIAYVHEVMQGSCPESLRKTFGPISPKLLRQAADIDVALVKVEGKEAFVTYSTPGVRSQIMYLKEEGGEWKVGKVNADRLL